MQLQDHEVPDFCRAIVDGSPMGMAFVTGADHAIRYANEPFCRLVGKSAPAIQGVSFACASPAGDECLALLERVSDTGLAEIHIGGDHRTADVLYWSYVMWPVLAPDGSTEGIMIQVMESTSFHLQAVAMNQALMIGSVKQHELLEAAESENEQLGAEIAQRKRAETELRNRGLELAAGESRYRALVETIPQIVWTTSPEGALQFVNAKWFEYFGKDLNVALTSGWSQSVHPDDAERTQAAWQYALQSGSPAQIEHRLRNSFTGHFRWFFSSAVPVHSEGGAVAQWFGTSTDVEERKRAELASFSKQKLESLGLLAGGIAHDFNNLLCAILGGASMVAASLGESHPMQGALADIVTASERAAHLTRQMLAYAGKGRFVMEHVDIPERVQSTCALIKAFVPKTVELIFDTAANMPPVEADSGQMEQVIMNLVLNAVEAIPDNAPGTVVLKTSLQHMSRERLEAGPAGMRGLRPGSYVAIEVRDNGSGMDSATQATIFDPFFTTKFAGRGLGLAAVEGILRSQGGAVDVESELGLGSVFRVYLPVSSRAKKLASAVSAEPLHNRGGCTVLVVDDDEMVRRMTRLILENAGFRVRVVAGGQDAMEMLSGGAEEPVSLVVLDLAMPGMSGKQVMQRMKAAGMEIPVLISSGYNERDVLNEFAGLNIAGFIQKPFTPRQLADRVIGALNDAAGSLTSGCSG